MDILSGLIDAAGKDQVFVNQTMDRYTTFRVGGPADYLVTPDSADKIIKVMEIAMVAGIPYYIVGNGSNLLVRDKGYRGIVIVIGEAMSAITLEENHIRAQAGALLSRIGAVAADQCLSGFEFASGIPGSIGGACVMNAGAYGGEMKDVLFKVKAITPERKIQEFTLEEMGLGYRHSFFSGKEYVIVEAEVELKPGSEAEIRAYMKDLTERRTSKQPLEYPSAGSTFKRPEGHFAGKLIEDSGLKGRGVGGACVSEKHTGFIINKDHATAQDVLDTIELVKQTVFTEQGIVLEPEVRIIGEI